MLTDKDAIAMVAVKDINIAAAFYEGTLGMRRDATEGDEVITYRSGSTRLNVYHSEFAGTNKATAVTWNVGREIDAIVAALSSKGVKFEHYDMPGLHFDKGIHQNRNMKVAWFKDPDGNILSIVSA